MTTNATNETRIDGAVHDAVTSERGTSANEQVVALRFDYTRGTHGVTTTVVIDLPAARALAAQLFGLLHDAKRLHADSVALGDECPRCGNWHVDELVYHADTEHVHCTVCDKRYVAAR